MKRINGANVPETEEELRQWEQEWSDMMVTIWTENIMRLGIVDTGNLMRSLTGHVVANTDRKEMIHEFALYGLYVARGTGPAYKWKHWTKNQGEKEERVNEGDLEFLSPSYRVEEGLNKPRKVGPAWGGKKKGGHPRSKKKNWFLKKYLRSMYVLAEMERNVYGEMFMGNLSNVLDAILGGGVGGTIQDRNGRDMSHVLANF